MGVSARRRRYQLWTRSEGAPQAGQATRSAGARAVTRMVRSWRSICSNRTLVKFGNIVSRRSLHAQHYSSDVPADHRFTECVPEPIFSTLYSRGSSKLRRPGEVEQLYEQNATNLGSLRAAPESVRLMEMPPVRRCASMGLLPGCNGPDRGPTRRCCMTPSATPHRSGRGGVHRSRFTATRLRFNEAGPVSNDHREHTRAEALWSSLFIRSSAACRHRTLLDLL
jgi:hypothetical protein